MSSLWFRTNVLESGTEEMMQPRLIYQHAISLIARHDFFSRRSANMDRLQTKMALVTSDYGAHTHRWSTPLTLVSCSSPFMSHEFCAAVQKQFSSSRTTKQKQFRSSSEAAGRRSRSSSEAVQKQFRSSSEAVQLRSRTTRRQRHCPRSGQRQAGNTDKQDERHSGRTIRRTSR